jgi:NAD(P)-dependent dehydrogenase (short-subunit alcohol dehydrogenase family)
MKKRILITGSTTGLGLISGEMLLKQGHDVVFHARSKTSKTNKDYTYVYGDLSKIDETRDVVEQANSMGAFDSVIHNAGVYTSTPEELFAVNVVAPYLMTKTLKACERHIYLSSGMHLSGTMNLNPHKCSYSDTKLFVLMIAKWFAKEWPDRFINAVDPGWVPTRMGGSGAPDDLNQGAETQSWLAVSSDPTALVSGKYFHHLKQHKSNPIADESGAQEQLISFLDNVCKK